MSRLNIDSASGTIPIGKAGRNVGANDLVSIDAGSFDQLLRQISQSSAKREEVTVEDSGRVKPEGEPQTDVDSNDECVDAASSTENEEQPDVDVENENDTVEQVDSADEPDTQAEQDVVDDDNVVEVDAELEDGLVMPSSVKESSNEDVESTKNIGTDENVEKVVVKDGENKGQEESIQPKLKTETQPNVDNVSDEPEVEVKVDDKPSEVVAVKEVKETVKVEKSETEPEVKQANVETSTEEKVVETDTTDKQQSRRQRSDGEKDSDDADEMQLEKSGDVKENKQKPITPESKAAAIATEAIADVESANSDTTPKAGATNNQTNVVEGTKTNQQARASVEASDTQTQGVDTTDRVRFARRVANAFQSLSQRGGTIRMRLNPPELGALRLEISVKDGTMIARLETETQAAKNVVLENLSALRERLAEQDIKVKQFDVDIADHSADGSPEGPDEQKQWNEQTKQGAASKDVASENDALDAVVQRVAVNRAGQGTRLNLIG